MKNIDLLFRLFNCQYSTGKEIILDSGLYALMCIAILCQFGAFIVTVINKRRYWPTYIFKLRIEAHTAIKDVGEYNSSKGKLNIATYGIFWIKEDNRVMKISFSYRGLSNPDFQRKLPPKYWRKEQERMFTWSPLPTTLISAILWTTVIIYGTQNSL